MSTSPQETTPDQLLESFRGRSFKSIILFTIIVHLVIVGGSSIPYFIKIATGKSDSNLSEEQRSDAATREATTAIRDIASKYGIKPQDLSSRLAGGKPKASPAEAPETPATTEKPATPETTTPTEDPEKPKSTIEQELEVKETGPKVPPIPTEEAGEDDLFR